jgi:hypothetical protein
MPRLDHHWNFSPSYQDGVNDLEATSGAVAQLELVYADGGRRRDTEELCLSHRTRRTVVISRH